MKPGVKLEINLKNDMTKETYEHENETRCEIESEIESDHISKKVGIRSKPSIL